MTTLFYIGLGVHISYLVFILKKIGIKRLPSLSHSYYELEEAKKGLGVLFQLTLISMTFLLMPAMIEITPNSFQFLAFLTAFPIMAVGIAPRILGDSKSEKKVHYYSAYFSAGCSLALMVCMALFVASWIWWVIAGSLIVAGLAYLKWKQLTFMAEMAAFAWILISYSILLIIK